MSHLADYWRDTDPCLGGRTRPQVQSRGERGQDEASGKLTFLYRRSSITGNVSHLLRHAALPVMEWSGRAPAPPVRDAGNGLAIKEHGHVQQIRFDRCHDGASSSAVF